MSGGVPRSLAFRMLLSPAVFFFWLYSQNNVCLVRASASDAVYWVRATTQNATALRGRAVVAGIDDKDGGPLWVIRAHLAGDVIPGKLAVDHNAAYVPWGGKENAVDEIEVCCADFQSKLEWIQDKDGHVPKTAIVGGITGSETLYIGRAWHKGTLVPGKIHKSQHSLYIPFGGLEIKYNTYEVLCKA